MEPASDVHGAPLPLRARLARSGLLPLIPIFAWNAALAPSLPASFAEDTAVPGVVLAAELVGRLLVFVGSTVLVLGLETRWQKRGCAVFVVGSLVYALSWLPPLLDPSPSWLWLLPYVLPVSWLVGLGLMARSGGYIVYAVLFVFAHTTHGLYALGALMAAR